MTHGTTPSVQTSEEHWIPIILPLHFERPGAGENELSLPQTTKKIWEYIKSRELQDPSDRRQIRCDEKMRAVFKVDKVHMFTMTKLLSQQMYSPEE